MQEGPLSAFELEKRQEESLRGSMSELHRILGRDSVLAMVVLDSYYKEVHNDRPKIVPEIAERLGFRAEHRIDFPVTKIRGSMNRRSRRCRKHFSANEAVVIMRASHCDEDSPKQYDDRRLLFGVSARRDCRQLRLPA
jgi:hypothetical protein